MTVEMPDPIARLNGALEGRYRIESELGEGGMASVYLASDLRHERKVALKVLKPELAALVGARRFLAEIKTTANLQHPHILPLFDSGTADGFLFYVMPFVDGETLRQRLDRDGSLSVEDAIAIALEIADGLAHAHGKGVVHRDIKPENVLLAGRHASIADFGIARGVQEAGGGPLTQTGMAIGTPTYMSPEQASGDTRVDSRSDIYSLACVVYEMLAGEPPYTGPTAASILAKKLTQPAPDVRVVREAVPPALQAALGCALARSPSDRFATAAEFGGALSASAPMAPGDRMPHSVGPRGTRRVFRNVLLAVGALGLLVAGALGINLTRTGTSAGIERDMDVIAVLPFSVRGSDDLAYLREGMVDLLSTKLDGVGGLRVADPQAIFAALPDGDPAGLSDADASRVSAALGAGRVLHGSVLPSGGRLLIRASVRNGAGQVEVEASAEGPEDDLFGIVDRLVSDLVASGITGQQTQLASLEELTTQSNEALRLYLEGIRNFRRGLGMLETTELMRRSVALDSTFALAAYWAGYMAVYQELPALEHFRLATRHRTRLSVRTQMRLAAALAAEEGRHAEAIALYRRLVDRYPDDVAGWFQLAEQVSHTGSFVGETAGAARSAYEQAVALDPGLAPAYLHLAIIGGLERDTLALEAWAERLDSLGVEPIWAGMIRMTRAGLSADTVLLDQSLATFLDFETDYPPATVAGTIAALAGSVMASDPGAARRIMEQYTQQTVSDTTRAVMKRRLARFESAFGRFGRAEEQLRTVGPDHRPLLPYDLAWVSLHPLASGGERAGEAERLLRALTPEPGSAEAVVRHYLLARLAVRAGELERFRTELEVLRREHRSSSPESGGLGRDLILELSALEASLQGEAARGLDSLLASRYWAREEMWPDPGDGTYFEGPLADRWPAFFRAELSREAGRTSEANLWYRVAADGIWHRAIGQARLGELAEEAGDTAMSRALRESVNRMWADADEATRAPMRIP
jgi:TolB-like protein